MIESAEKGSEKPAGYVILDNSAGKLIPYLEQHAPHILNIDTIEIIIAEYNMGVARGWNKLMDYVRVEHGDDAWCLVVNDDIEFHQNTIEKFGQIIRGDFDGFSISPVDDFHAKNPVICGDIGSVNAFSMFAVNPKTLYTTVGYFDETLYPAYMDDNDMKYRLDLRNIELYRISGATCEHNEGGSATLKSYSVEEENLHHHQFRRNQFYYYMKWGGLPGEEVFKHPFNNQDIMAVMQEVHKRYGF